MFNLIRLVVLGVVIYFLGKFLKRLFLSSHSKAGNPSVSEDAGKGEDLIEDPCCHRYLPMSQAYRASVDGEDVFFCSEQCCEKYKNNNS